MTICCIRVTLATFSPPCRSDVSVHHHLELNHPRAAFAQPRGARRHVGRFADRTEGRVVSCLQSLVSGRLWQTKPQKAKLPNSPPYYRPFKIWLHVGLAFSGLPQDS